MDLGDYTEAIDVVKGHFCSEAVRDSLRPINIIRNGSIESPGVSDIDLIFVFDDAFENGVEFIAEYRKAIQSIQNGDVFFVHDPMVVSKSVIEDLPYYTKNPVSGFEFYFGDPPSFKHKSVASFQALLICAEFIQFRVFQLLSMLASKNISTRGILLRGHSMKHSIELCENAGVNLEDEKFSGFRYVEALRNKVERGGEVVLPKGELEDLYRCIILEFYSLYKKVAKAIEKMVVFYSSSESQYSYDSNVVVVDPFSYESAGLGLSFQGGKLEYKGMSWVNMFLKDCYLNDKGVGGCVIYDELREEIVKRRQFFERIWLWNYKAFGSVSAGLSPMPCVVGEELERKVLKQVLCQ